MSKIVVKQRVTGDYYFHLKASNGSIVVTSQDYASKAGVYNAIESMRKNSHTETIEDNTDEDQRIKRKIKH